MKTKYYVWKDGKQSPEKQDWIEMTPLEFIELCNSNRNLKQENRRYFYQLPGLESGDTYLYLECTYEQYKESRLERYKRMKEKKEIEELESSRRLYYSVSFDTVAENEMGDDFTLQDLIPDPDSDFEDRLILSSDVQSALKTLTPDELEIIEMLYLSEYAVSERELARQMKLPQKTLNNRKIKILSKIKKSLAHS